MKNLNKAITNATYLLKGNDLPHVATLVLTKHLLELCEMQRRELSQDAPAEPSVTELESTGKCGASLDDMRIQGWTNELLVEQGYARPKSGPGQAAHEARTADPCLKDAAEAIAYFASRNPRLFGRPQTGPGKSATIWAACPSAVRINSGVPFDVFQDEYLKYPGVLSDSFLDEMLRTFKPGLGQMKAEARNALSQLPGWARFLVWDKDCSLWAYSKEPNRRYPGQWAPCGGQTKRVGKVPFTYGYRWNESLQEVRP